MPEDIYSKVAGVTFKTEDGQSRQAMIRKFLKEGDDLELERQPDNPHDPNAVRVLASREYDDPKWIEYPTYDIGYLNAQLASELAPLMDVGRVIECKVEDITGGEEDNSLGVNIRLIIHSEEESEDIHKSVQALLGGMAHAELSTPGKPPAPPKGKTKLEIPFKGLMTVFEIFVGLASLLAGIIVLAAAASSETSEAVPILRAIVISILFLALALWMARLVFGHRDE